MSSNALIDSQTQGEAERLHFLSRKSSTFERQSQVIHWRAMNSLFTIASPPSFFPSLSSPLHICWGLACGYWLKKDAQCEIFEISFISGNMRPEVWETTPQVSLINCSKEVRGKDSICVILVKGDYMQSNTFFFFFGRKFLLVSWSFCKSWETIVTMKDFSAFLDMRR